MSSNVKTAFHTQFIDQSNVNSFISYTSGYYTYGMFTSIINNNSNIILHNNVINSQLNTNLTNQYLILNFDNSNVIAYDNQFYNSNIKGGIILNDKNSKSTIINQQKQVIKNNWSQYILNQDGYNSQNNLINPHIVCLDDYLGDGNPVISPILVSDGQSYKWGNKKITEQYYPYQIIRKFSQTNPITLQQLNKLLNSINYLDNETIYVLISSNETISIDFQNKMHGKIVFIANGSSNIIDIKNQAKSCKLQFKNFNLNNVKVENCKYIKFINCYIQSSNLTTNKFMFFKKNNAYTLNGSLNQQLLNCKNILIENSNVYFINEQKFYIKNVLVGLIANKCSNIYFNVFNVNIQEYFPNDYYLNIYHRPIIFLSLNGSNIWFGNTTFNTKIYCLQSISLIDNYQETISYNTINLNQNDISSKYNINRIPFILKYCDRLSKINHSHDFSKVLSETYNDYTKNTIPTNALYQFVKDKSNSIIPWISNVNLLSSGYNCDLILEDAIFSNYNNLQSKYNARQPHFSFYSDDTIANSVQMACSISNQHQIFINHINIE